MRSSVLTAMLLAALGAMHAQASGHLIPSIGVFFDFENEPSAEMVQAMEREVGAIMDPAGLIFSWRKMGSEGEESTFADLVVLHFKGSCQAAYAPVSELGVWPESEAVLASTRTSHGQILHFTDIRCDEVRRYLSTETASLKQGERDAVYGRALGRIVSHEMYHIFAGTEKHASDGVARAYYSRRELVQPAFAFGAKETNVLRDFSSRALTAGEAEPEP